MGKFIHIKAESQILTVNELCSEKKCVKRLEQIRDTFLSLNSRSSYQRRFPNDTLVVKTCVNNPELPFLNQ